MGDPTSVIISDLSSLQIDQKFWCSGLRQGAEENHVNNSFWLFEAIRISKASTMMTTAMKRSSVLKAVVGGIQRAYLSLAVGSDIVAAAPNVSLQKARSWDEGISSKFATTPLHDIFKGKKVVIFGLPGAYTGVCSAQHVPSYKNNIGKFKAKGVDSVICVAVNDPYVINGWAEELEANHAIKFYGDFDGKFHQSLDLTVDLSSALLGTRATRWSAYVEDCKVKVLNVEKAPSEFKVSGGDHILAQI